MANRYWNDITQAPDRLFGSLALLVSPARDVSTRLPKAREEQVPDLSGVEVDESGLDFLTEYRAGLPDVTPEPIEELFEVPDPVPSGVIPHEPDAPAAETDTSAADDPAGQGEDQVAGLAPDEDGEPYFPESDAFEQADTSAENSEGTDAGRPEPEVIYVRDYQPDLNRGTVDGTPAAEGTAGATPITPEGTNTPTTSSSGVPQNPGTPGFEMPNVNHPPLAPIAIPTVTSASPQTPMPFGSGGEQSAIVLPKDSSNTTQPAAHVNAMNADIRAEQAHIAGLENFDPSLYLDFDDHASETGEETVDGEGSDGGESVKTRRVFADFGAGKRITQTENPAQAMQVLRELTVFRD